MKYMLVLVTSLLFNLPLFAQEGKLNKTRFVAGLSAPELLHAGITHRFANASQLGLTVGGGPTLGGVWPTLNLEHRLYIGNNSVKSGQKVWFIRQGTTFFPAAKSPQQFTFNLTAGKDVVFSNPGKGISIDAGVFYLPESERSSVILVRSLHLWPALRFEFYFSL